MFKSNKQIRHEQPVQEQLELFAAFEKYVKAIKEAEAKRWEQSSYDMKQVPTFSFTTGDRYWKILRTSYGQTSVHCFVERATGDILKAETFSRPAKKARGNIKNETYPLTGYEFYNRK